MVFRPQQLNQNAVGGRTGATDKNSFLQSSYRGQLQSASKQYVLKAEAAVG